MTRKINEILEQVLKNVKPEENEIDEIRSSLDKILEILKKKLLALKIDAELFVGGSFAKNTLIKKDYYDIDVFIRFSKEHKKELPFLMRKILSGMNKVSLVHGSRDYFRVSINPKLYIEVIPVLKISKPEQAENITDLS